MVHEFSVRTPGKGLHEVTATVVDLVRRSGVREGLCTLFIRHTAGRWLDFIWGTALVQITLYVLSPTIRHFGQVALVRTSCVVVLPSTTSSRFASSCTTVC